MTTYYVLDIIQSTLPISVVTIGRDTGCLLLQMRKLREVKRLAKVYTANGELGIQARSA